MYLILHFFERKKERKKMKTKPWNITFRTAAYSWDLLQHLVRNLIGDVVWDVEVDKKSRTGRRHGATLSWFLDLRRRNNYVRDGDLLRCSPILSLLATHPSFRVFFLIHFRFVEPRAASEEIYSARIQLKVKWKVQLLCLLRNCSFF